MTFLVQECYESSKKHEFYRSIGERSVNIRTEECFDKVLYHVNLRILKCKIMNVITMQSLEWASSIFFEKKIDQAKGQIKEKKRSMQYFCSSCSKDPLLCRCPVLWVAFRTPPSQHFAQQTSSASGGGLVHYAEIVAMSLSMGEQWSQF
jgi:hypothetical protein